MYTYRKLEGTYFYFPEQIFSEALLGRRLPKGKLYVVELASGSIFLFVNENNILAREHFCVLQITPQFDKGALPFGASENTFAGKIAVFMCLPATFCKIYDKMYNKVSCGLINVYLNGRRKIYMEADSAGHIFAFIIKAVSANCDIRVSDAEDFFCADLANMYLI